MLAIPMGQPLILNNSKVGGRRGNLRGSHLCPNDQRQVKFEAGLLALSFAITVRPWAFNLA